ncbi:MAG: putative apolipoprotein N-acyltransferase N-acyltransferase, rane protein [Pseudomonadota bacterium]
MTHRKALYPLTWSGLFLVMAGLAHALALSTPWNHEPAGWLQLLAMAVLVAQLQVAQSPGQAAARAWVFATSWLVGTFWWLFVAMNTYGDLSAPLAALAVLALALALAAYYALAGAVYRAIAPSGVWARSALFAALWTMAEMARGTWLTGFGWGAAAYAHVNGLGVLVKWLGAYGLTALVAFVAAVLAGVWARPKRWQVLAGVVLVSPAFWWSPTPLPSYSVANGGLSVALLQGNIAQDEKFQMGTGVADALQWYGEQLRVQPAALVVAPETALPLLPQQLPPDYWPALNRAFASGSQAALLGMPLGDLAQGYTNSVVGLKPVPAAGVGYYQYDKHHLVPFGEFIPPLFRWFTNLMNIPLGDFNRGSVGQTSFEWQGQRLAPNVCYEDLFGEELGARFLLPDQAPTVLVNVSNLAWFGNTVALDQHRHISRMRALEFERPVIRATNTGDTAIIDHMGRVTQALPRHTRGVLLGEVTGRTGITPFAWWVSRWGQWPVWLACAAVVLATWAVRRKAQSAAQA